MVWLRKHTLCTIAKAMTDIDLEIFEELNLDSSCKIYFSNLPEIEHKSLGEFNALWNLRPKQFHKISMFGKEVETPRWQQSFGKNYNYSGSTNEAEPIPKEFCDCQEWCKVHIDSRLNGFLVNWYDGKKGHYIGPHRDDTNDLELQSPIVTLSLGEERILRFRPYGGKGFKDITVGDGEIIIIPWKTNQNWTHEVPNLKRYKGKRISLTLRAYKNSEI